MSTYLDLCRRFVGEYGIAGGAGPSSVTGQVGELGSVVRWIADAELYVNTLWTDWRYLWREYEETVTAGSNAPPANSQGLVVREWDKRSFFVNKATSSFVHLSFAGWRDFQRMFGAGVHSAGLPDVITMAPNRALVLNMPASEDIVLSGEFWESPSRMTAATDQPKMPAEFERIIIARAAIMYGNKEDAPEVIAGAEAEYMDMLDKLQANQLDSFREDRMSNADTDLVVEVL